MEPMEQAADQDVEPGMGRDDVSSSKSTTAEHDAVVAMSACALFLMHFQLGTNSKRQRASCGRGILFPLRFEKMFRLPQ